MPDNIDVSPGSGATIAADDVSSVLYQLVKPAYGSDGTATMVDANNGLPVLDENSADLLTAAQAIQTAIEILDNIVSGSEAQVDVVAALPAGTNNIGDVDVDSVAIPSSVYHGQTTVSTAGTEVELASTQALLSGVTVKALAGNSGAVYVGTNPVTSSTGFELSAGDQIFIECDDLATVYIDSAQDGDGVSWIGS